MRRAATGIITLTAADVPAAPAVKIERAVIAGTQTVVQIIQAGGIKRAGPGIAGTLLKADIAAGTIAQKVAEQRRRTVDRVEGE